MATLFRRVRPALHLLPAEFVHGLGLHALQYRLFPPRARTLQPMLRMRLWDMDFANPIGLAAGFDKNAVAIDGLLKQGFGFVETGTVTPRPQPGNPKPRLFRLPADEAVINRLGFNNGGLENYLRHFRQRDVGLGVAGANIGKNKDSADAAEDYVQGLRAVYPYADYITINISSPNTQGLRDLQQRDALEHLLSALSEVRGACMVQHLRKVPLLLKVAPDLTMLEKEAIAQAVVNYGMDGLIVSNTTIGRPDSLQGASKQETGGLSGRPLFALSTACLSDFYRLTKGVLPLVGVGGIASAQDAYTKIRAGATLVQLYTALVYQGFAVVTDITSGLPPLLKRDGFAHVKDAVGADVK